MRNWTWMVWAVLTLGGAATARAQTGMAPTDWDELAKIPFWEPEPTGYAENFSVDHRDRLPAVGTQSMGDCAAWAFCYAGKSFLEANDQGWKPDRPGRTFSPTFLFNQLVKGAESGLTPLPVLNFLKEKGCATLATTPYLVKDWQTKPSSRAMAEAELFKISHFAVMKDGPDMRTALQQGHVIVIGVRTNPIFNGARYPVYTKDLHATGHAQRQPDQKHGFHALAVVGFDDTTQAFLIMNSWGTRWGQSGFCWVHYDVAKAFNSKARNVTSNLIDWAVVMYDVKEKVDVGPDGVAIVAPVNKDSLAAIGAADYRGFDPNLKKHVFFFNVALSGQKKALDLVRSVAWSYDDRGQRQTLTAASRLTGFSANGRSVINEFPVTGKVTFADGTTKDVAIQFNTPAPQAENRRLNFKVVSRYSGKSNSGSPMWEWSVAPQFPASEKQDVAKATWDLSAIPNEREKQRVFDQKTLQHPAYSGPGGLFFGAARITGRYFFTDGTVKDVALDVPADDPVDDTFRMESEWQEDGVGADGKTVYSYQVRLRMPMKDFFRVKTVNWDLGPGMANRHPHTHSYNDYTASGTTTREFRARCTITMHDGGGAKSFDRWIELGKSARFANPHRIALESTDAYLGRRGSGTKTWNVKLFPVGDTATIERIDQIVYTLPESFKSPPIAVKAGDQADLSMALWADGETAVPAKVIFKDGNYTNLDIAARPRTPAFDGLSLQVFKAGEPENQAMLTRLGLIGPVWDLDRIRAVDYRFRSRGRWEHVPVESQYLMWPALLDVTARADVGERLYAVVTFADGAQEWLATTPYDEHRPAPPGGIRLQVRERFRAHERTGAGYALDAKIVGEGPLVDQIESVDYTIDTVAKAGIKGRADAGWQTLPIHLRGRAKVEATLTFKPELKLPPQTLPAVYTTATAPRPDKPLVLRELRQPWHEDDDRQWVVYLDGWESALHEVTGVTYTLPKSVSAGPVKVAERDADHLAPFAYRGRSTTPVMVEAAVTTRDGKTQALTLEVAGPSEPLDFAVEQRYWGIDPRLDATRPAYELTYRVTGDWRAIGRLDEPGWGTAHSIHAYPVTDSAPYLRKDYVSEAVTSRGLSPSAHGRPLAPIKGREVALTAPAVDEIRVTTVGRPVPGQPEVKEWTVSIQGPERLLGTVREVVYTLDDDAKTRVGQVKAEERWSDAGDGFAMRITRPELPAIEATVRFDGDTPTARAKSAAAK